MNPSVLHRLAVIACALADGLVETVALGIARLRLGHARTGRR